MIPTLMLVVLIVFLFVHILPGDPARLVAGTDADEATIALIREDLGLDLPLPQQFLRYVQELSHGNLGRSLRTKRPVTQEIAFYQRCG